MSKELPVQEILSQLLEMREKRNWKQFHTLRNLAVSLSLESSEVLEIFQWTDGENLSPEQTEHLGEELADVLGWVLLLAHDAGIDLGKATLAKIKKNKKKYPVKKAKGNAKKYTELTKSKKKKEKK